MIDENEEKTRKYKIQLKNCINGVIGFALYFIMSYSIAIPLALAGGDYNKISITSKQIYLICYNLFTMFLFYYLYKKDLKRDFADFKKNYKTYFKKYFKVWLIAIVVMYISNIVILLLKYTSTGEIGIANNEETIRETLALAPVYTFVSASIYAPFVEELTFRKSFRNIFSDDWFYVLFSAFVFGGMHVFTSGMHWFDLLYLIPYCTPGLALAYIFLKTKNIFCSISIHFMHNTLLMIIQVIFLLKGML